VVEVAAATDVPGAGVAGGAAVVVATGKLPIDHGRLMVLGVKSSVAVQGFTEN
jgi:hypothetical protein